MHKYGICFNFISSVRLFYGVGYANDGYISHYMHRSFDHRKVKMMVQPQLNSYNAMSVTIVSDEQVEEIEKQTIYTHIRRYRHRHGHWTHKKSFNSVFDQTFSVYAFLYKMHELRFIGTRFCGFG